MKYILQPNYHPFYQLPYCCVPATLQWILYRHGLDIIDQETIGAELGLRLPLKGKEFFTNKKIKYLSREPEEGYGTQIEKEKYSIQRFFDKYKIPLAISEMHCFSDDAALKDFLINQLSNNYDVIIRYHNEALRRENQKGCGHFSVITEYDNQSDIVTIGDPEIPHYKKASVDQFLYSISDRIDGTQRGLYIVTRK